MGQPDESHGHSRIEGLKVFLKENGWRAPAALSAFAAVFTVLTAVFSALAANDSAKAAAQLVRLQQTLEKRALEDQRARLDFSGGNISYSGLTDIPFRGSKHVYIIQIKLRNFGVRPALDTQISLDIGRQHFFSAPRTVPGGSETSLFIQLQSDQLIERFDDGSKIGTVFYDQWPIPNSSSNNEAQKISICGPAEIRSLSVYKSDGLLGSSTKFVLSSETTFLYDPKGSFDNSPPFYMSQILRGTPAIIDCKQLEVFR